MTPEWDIEQLEVIMDPASSWQVVTAGPGTGKSEVACQRIAFLVDDGVEPTKILLVSFTRTAVAELRQRIVRYSDAGGRASSVRISTIDSHAWHLRAGFEDDPLQSEGKDGYELNIQRLIEMFEKKQPELLDFMQTLEHLVIDEAQDVVGLRARLVLLMLRSLSMECGVTILADPAQAIYGFTSDDDREDDGPQSLLELLDGQSPRTLSRKQLSTIHRTESARLISVYTKTRDALVAANDLRGHVARVQQTIRETSGGDIGAKSLDELVGLLSSGPFSSALVLFRRRAEALLASSYCSSAGLEHRLRMSGFPSTSNPWVGWLFGEADREIVSRDDFRLLWGRQEARAPCLFGGLNQDLCWEVLHKAAAAKREGAIDLVHLRRQLARSRPPLELSVAECGSSGPILGTIHASKGREANTVVLVVPTSRPSDDYDGDDVAQVLEEGRVYYVGATRARQVLVVAANVGVPVGYLDSRRVYRLLPGKRVQLEVGREKDVDKLAHLAWSNAKEIQELLARSCTSTTEVRAICLSEYKYSWRIELTFRESERLTRDVEIAEMSQDFRNDLASIWGIVDTDKALKPPHYIEHLYLIGATTVGLTDAELSAVREPYSRTGIALAPVIKGFPVFPFLGRWHKGRME